MDVDGSVGGNAGQGQGVDPERGERSDSLGLTAQQRHSELAYLFEGTAAVDEADGPGAGSDDTETAGVGDESLPAIDRPHLRRARIAAQQTGLDDGVELHELIARVVQRDRRGAEEESGQLGSG